MHFACCSSDYPKTLEGDSAEEEKQVGKVYFIHCQVAISTVYLVIKSMSQHTWQYLSICKICYYDSNLSEVACGQG